MSLEKITSISGFSGLFKIITTRKDGVVAEDLQTGKSMFASSRKHQFTPLASIGIYTDDGDSIALFQLYKNMLAHLADMPENEQSEEANKTFFGIALPTTPRTSGTTPAPPGSSTSRSSATRSPSG